MTHSKLFAALLVGSFVASGCSAVKAVLDKDARWAFKEPAPMSVVVRRAEIARAIADHVDVLLTAPLADDTATVLSLQADQATELLTAAAADPVYGSQPLRVMPAEAWLATLHRVCPKRAAPETLLGQLGPEVGASFEDLSARHDALAELEGQLQRTKVEIRKAPKADKAALRATAKQLKAEIDRETEALVGPQAKLVGAVALAARELPPEVQDRVRPVVQAMLLAVEDAQASDSAAMIRYPMAMSGLHNDLQLTAKRFAADVIEEQTERRPSTNGLTPKVQMQGTDVELTLNGLDAEALGKLEVAEVVTETATRTKDYAGHTVMLLAFVNKTEKRLGFQQQVLGAWARGLGAAPAEGDVPGPARLSSLEVLASVAAKKAGDAEASGEGDGERAPRRGGEAPWARSAGGMVVMACGPVEEGSEAGDGEGKGKGKGKGKRKGKGKEKRNGKGKGKGKGRG